MDVSVILVNYNTYQMTRECIDSIFEQTKDVSFEIILVDNASTDESKEFFSQDHRIKYVYSFENLGFGRANNIGMMLSKGDYVFLLNTDTLLLNNAIKLFLDKATNDSNVFLGSWLLNKKGDIITSFGDEPTITDMLKRAANPYLIVLGAKKREMMAHSSFTYLGKECEVGYVSGANMFFHRSIFERYGAFDHNFFMYFEEAEWQKRMKQYGIKSKLIEGPRIIHLVGGSVDKNSQKYRSLKSRMMMKDSRRYFLKKYYQWPYRFLFFILYNLLDLPFVILSPRYRFLDKIKYVIK